ncbi:MAG: redoxin domain-containing protein, partial [Bacteroidota bacterium]
EVKLEDFQGKSNVVLLFFPLAFTGVCTTEMCSMRDNLGTYNNLNAEVMGISVDSLFTLEKFKEAESLNFTLLSDFNKDVSKTYGAFYEDFVLGMKGVSKRAAFVIDKAGIIRHIEVLDNAGELPNFGTIKSTLGSLK